MIPTNGEMRMKIYDGSGKSLYKWVFAGNAHDCFNEGTAVGVEPKLNFDFIKEAFVRNKLICRRKKEHEKK